MKTIKYLLVPATSLALLACGSSDNSSPKPSTPSASASCQSQNKTVNWQQALTADAEKLSQYQLFANPCDPTQNPSNRGLAYDLSAPLFTDYASKYRFIFIPEGKTASYSATESFDFPVGSIIAKTFTMPADTSQRGVKNERLIETRLLIKKEAGWVARPYVWNAEQTEATWDTTGEQVAINNLKHGSDNLSFTYQVPNQNACTTCHQFNPNGDNDAVNGVDPTPVRFSPIGPKARFLNSDFDYGQGPENQLQKWVAENMLSGLPQELSSIQKAATFSNNKPLSDYTASKELLTATAKSWLDINCGHCHRTEGQASNTAFRADYNIPWQGNEGYHGACAVAVSGASEGSARIIEPGNAGESLLFNRLNTTKAGVTMPPLGRAVIHQEGTALIKAWIDGMDPDLCQ
ncbi:SO2930 family diheme c-type cytochrome [Bacterioplanoides sp.]|uniref:SO2930 family diheme c-type cytochrome n=1 Tax=Bacterioplanoides sp. TaxID=2066072 RepID=UPI003B5B7F6E